MTTDREDGPAREAHRVEAPSPVTGRLGMLAAMSMFAGAVPIPMLPRRVLAQVRGAVVHEAVARHGLSLSTDARQVLANPATKDRMREALRRAAEMIVKRVLRRLGPLGLLSAVARSVEVYALGVMTDRYLGRVRRARSARILEPEARRLREAIDRAVVHALAPSLDAAPLMLPEGAADTRDEFTRWMDTALVTMATLPSYLERRLVSAFDEVADAMPSLGDD